MQTWRKCSLLTSGIALLMYVLAGSSTASERRTAIPLDFLTTREASDPQISPDGGTVVFVLEEPGPQPKGEPWRGDQDLWRVPADGNAAPQRWISSPERDWSPRWSPDGTRLAFLSQRKTIGSTEPRTQIYLVNADGDQLHQLTQLSGNISQFRWSPDGRSVAFLSTQDPVVEDGDPQLSNQPQPLTKLNRISVSGEELRVISPSGLNVIDFDWSPDGTRIAALISPTATNEDVVNTRQLVVLNSDTGEVERRFSNRIGWNSPVLWSPDSKFIHVDIWSPSPGDAWSPALISTDNGQSRLLLEGARATFSDPRWSADSRFLMGQLLKENQTTLVKIDRETGLRQNLSPSGVNVFAKDTYSSHAASGDFVLLKASQSTPPDIWIIGSNKPPKQLTRLNPKVEQIRFGAVRDVHWHNPNDGKRVHGFVVLPVGHQPGRRYPMVTILHGGPTSAWQRGWPDGFTDWGQLLAAKGYITFFPNVRGSLGAGVDYINANTGDLGGIDYIDVISGVDQLVADGLADPDRLGIGGYSYGGYLSSWAITQTTRFKAAVSGGIIADWVSFYGTTDIPHYLRVFLEAPPFTDQSLARARSPVNHSAKVTTPVLFYAGSNDTRTPPGQVDQMHRAVQDAGVTTLKVIYPGERHGFVNRTQKLDLMHRMLSWYQRYLTTPD